MRKHILKIGLISLAYLGIIGPENALAGTCRNLKAASPMSYITYPIGTSNTHIAERMRSGHVYPTRLQVLRQMAAKTGRRVNPANPTAGFLNYKVRCRVLGRTFSRSSRRVSYRYKCYASGRYCSLNVRGPIRDGVQGEVRGRRGRAWRP